MFWTRVKQSWARVRALSSAVDLAAQLKWLEAPIEDAAAVRLVRARILFEAGDCRRAEVLLIEILFRLQTSRLPVVCEVHFLLGLIALETRGRDKAGIHFVFAMESARQTYSAEVFEEWCRKIPSFVMAEIAEGLL